MRAVIRISNAPERRKIGELLSDGPYMRTGRLRGTEQWLMDLAEDPEYARDLASKLADHPIQIGLEQLRRDNLSAAGLWIFNDIAGNQGTVMCPRTYEKISTQLWSKW